MIRVGVLGAKGRMGDWVTRLLETEYKDKAKLAARVDRDSAIEAVFGTDVVIDFSMPEGMLSVIRKSAGIPDAKLPAFVVGSTGWKIDERRELEALAARTQVLVASNFSTGVQALLYILRQSAPMLEQLGYTPVIVETHHRHKKDAPSGTAISIQRAIAPGGPGNIQTQSIRAGEIIGDHEVTFYGPGDHLTFGHFAQDRSIFARGAIDAALWLGEKRRNGQGHGGNLISMEAFFKERFLNQG